MKSLITAILLTLLLGCSGDVSESRNHKLPFSSLATIPSPAQSLLPPTFENPIRDYTVGLVPPPVAESEHRHYHAQAPVRQQPTHYSIGQTTPAEPSRTIVQQRSGYPVGSVRTAVHHQTHHSTNPVQPQVYQPKTVVYQQYQQPNTHHHHHHHHQQQSNNYDTGFVIPRVAKQHSHHSVPNSLQYYAPVTQSAVHQHSPHAHYTSAPVYRSPAIIEHVHPSVQHSAIVSRPVSSSGVNLIQTYPSVSYAATAPQHGSTLNLGNAKLEPELVYIISEVLGRYDF